MIIVFVFMDEGSFNNTDNSQRVWYFENNLECWTKIPFSRKMFLQISNKGLIYRFKKIILNFGRPSRLLADL